MDQMSPIPIQRGEPADGHREELTQRLRGTRTHGGEMHDADRSGEERNPVADDRCGAEEHDRRCRPRPGDGFFEGAITGIEVGVPIGRRNAIGNLEETGLNRLVEGHEGQHERGSNRADHGDAEQQQDEPGLLDQGESLRHRIERTVGAHGAR